MKVTKHRSGYTIRVSDMEHEMLEQLIRHEPLSGRAKAAHTRRVKGGNILRIDVDKSGVAARPGQGFLAKG